METTTAAAAAPSASPSRPSRSSSVSSSVGVGGYYDSSSSMFYPANPLPPPAPQQQKQSQQQWQVQHQKQVQVVQQSHQSDCVVDAYAQSVLESFAAPSGAGGAGGSTITPDSSLGPYVTSVLRRAGAESNDGKGGGEEHRLPADEEEDALVELLQEHCNLDASRAREALEIVSEAVRTGRVPLSYNSSASALAGCGGGGDNNKGGAGQFPSLRDLDAELPLPPSAVPDSVVAAVLSPIHADRLIPEGLLGSFGNNGNGITNGGASATEPLASASAAPALPDIAPTATSTANSTNLTANPEDFPTLGQAMKKVAAGKDGHRGGGGGSNNSKGPASSTAPAIAVKPKMGGAAAGGGGGGARSSKRGSSKGVKDAVAAELAAALFKTSREDLMSASSSSGDRHQHQRHHSHSHGHHHHSRSHGGGEHHHHHPQHHYNNRRKSDSMSPKYRPRQAPPPPYYVGGGGQAVAVAADHATVTSSSGYDYGQQHHQQNLPQDAGQQYYDYYPTTTAATTPPDPQVFRSVVEILLSLNEELSEEAAEAAAHVSHADINTAQYLVDRAMTAPPVCRHLLASGCYRKDCQYSHDLAGHTCMFWLKGRCGKGEGCPFKHGFDENALKEIEATVMMHQQQQQQQYDEQQQQYQRSTSDYYGSYPDPNQYGYDDGNYYGGGGGTERSSLQQLPASAPSSLGAGLSSSSFANVATQGYVPSSFVAGDGVSSDPSRLLPSQPASSADATGASSKRKVKIPPDVWIPHEARDASVFLIADPMERYRLVASTEALRPDVVDLHYQSTSTFDVVLSQVLPEKLEQHGAVWVVTGTGHHVGTGTHQKKDGALQAAVIEWLDEEGYVFARGKDRSGQGGAVLVEGKR